MTKTLISVHFPKAAGTSLLVSLKEALGHHALLLDYDDNPADPACRFHVDPPGFRRERRTSVSQWAAVHGHFHPEKYALVPADTRWLVTLLREPVDNLLSIYRFWRQLPSQGNAIHDYFLKHDLSPVELAELPMIGRLMTETYFGRWDMARFDLVGDYADYSAYVAALGRLLGVPLRVRSENLSPRQEIGPEVRDRLKQLLAPEIEFYERWRASGRLAELLELPSTALGSARRHQPGDEGLVALGDAR
jgi:hypothetical protein